ncbi:hypothetical protein R1flu_024577 [Riccia fluitans]|uniref:DNA 3'-5' helicase n=1 Tax=Riccia fluitans TaxID=41844 RepID=A0ABD1XVB0_9MARC
MDEFRISQKQLTEQQRERITRNFRAAKAIRDRKRSQLYNTPPSPSVIWQNHPGPERMSVDGCSSSGADFRSPLTFRVKKKTHVEGGTKDMHRMPLSELDPNVCVQNKVTPRKHKTVTTSNGGPLVTRTSHSDPEVSSHESKCASLVGSHAQVNVTPLNVSLSQAFSDDFDETLLQEIDALCGQRRGENGSIFSPATEIPEERNVDALQAVESVSLTDFGKHPGTLRKSKPLEEAKILGFISAVFQSPCDGKLEQAISSSTVTSQGAGGTCRNISASNAASNGDDKVESIPSPGRQPSDSNHSSSVELPSELTVRLLNQPEPAANCQSPVATDCLSAKTSTEYQVSHGHLSTPVSTTRTVHVDPSSSEALRNGRLKECVPNSDSPGSGPSPVALMPEVEASLDTVSARESHLTPGCSPFVSNNTPIKDSGLSPDGLIKETVPVYLQRLNLSQREAAASDITKPLLILAGPGSGKTSTMVARLIHMLEQGTEPKNVLAMTFTTAAATEMRERVGAAIGKTKAKELIISTFHSFCLQLCRTHADKLGRTSEFFVYGSGQQRKAVIEATRIALSENKAAGLPRVDAGKEGGSENTSPSLCREQAKKWQQFVTQAKCSGRTADYYEKSGNILGASVLKNYEKTLSACNALDYHDFISSAVKLFEEHRTVLEECQRTWCCILVDEFQDTSAMQYKFLRLLASHQRITIVGDDDQSIFGFNGANSAGFLSFRKDFPSHKEVRLHQNYRSTRCIVEAASAVIRNNNKRCQTQQAVTENNLGEKIKVRECRTESAQCAFVADAILMATSSSENFSFGSVAVLYRRQVTGKLFQTTFRSRKIPFNVHGVAFYRKKIIKNIIAIFCTVLPGRKDVFCRRVFKALYGGDKSESKKAVEYVEKISKSKNFDFLQAASEIFSAKVSGTFTRRQLALGRKVLSCINTVKHLVNKEQSLSAVISAVANLLPQRPVMESRAILTEDGRRLLNEDEDPRTVLEYLLDDVNEFLGKHYSPEVAPAKDALTKSVGCATVLRAFLDHMTAREEENFRTRRDDNNNAVTLTTLHQSKGLEWDTVFIVKANETEIPLLHEEMGCISGASISLEEERRLFYVGMTRARKNLCISYIAVDSDRQILQPTRFLAELPRHLLDFQDGVSQFSSKNLTKESRLQATNGHLKTDDLPDAQLHVGNGVSKEEALDHNCKGLDVKSEEAGNAEAQDDPETTNRAEAVQSSLRCNAFLKGFSVESRSVVAALFHTWAKKPSFQDPKRLLSKVGFVIDERLRSKGTKNKEVLINLKLALREEVAVSYAQNVLAWEKLPLEERTVLQAERQEHFQMQNCERSLAAAAATPKQISYLRSLGCTVDPTSRLHASRLIEQYKRL